MSAMPKPWQRPETGPSRIDKLTAQARQAAYLFQYGWLDLPEAVDRFQRHAVRSGAVAELGQDIVQAVAAAAFAHIALEDGTLIGDALAAVLADTRRSA